MITGNEPARPFESETMNTLSSGNFIGLSIRQELAARAMQGILSDPSNTDLATKFIKDKLGLPEETVYEYPKHYMQYISVAAVAAADALIAELNKSDPTDSGVVE